MKLGKRIGFQYLTYDKNGKSITRHDNYQYIVSPYYLINNFGRYYLLCNYREKYRALQTFRVDYMINPEIKDDWPIKRIEELKDCPKDFSITKYMNDHIYILDGDVIETEIELDGDWAILIVKDWFGENVKLSHKNGKIYTKIKCNETALYYWIMQYSDCVKVLSPDSFVKKVKNGLLKALERY